MLSLDSTETGTVKEVFTNTKHPYTEGMFNSLPNINARTNRLTPIPGLMPDPSNLPEGCPFAPRCKYATAKCMEEEPALFDTGDGQLIRCFYPEKEVRRSAEHKEITVNK